MIFINLWFTFHIHFLHLLYRLVWFQNARAKEKKAKLAIGSPREGTNNCPSPTGPDECKLCCVKYSPKLQIQEHVFSKKHLEYVKIAVEDGSLVPPTPGASALKESAIANTMGNDSQGNQSQTDENIMYGSLFLHPTVMFQSQLQQQQQHTENVITSMTHTSAGESLADLLDP
ncbi:hypothetical protein QAD02_013206 [Eretmocerus hayati]|uniref:Uncharacterized protein n=1 Tax=Eretmocerus hayati TaxID=131215 RepID=A0ACC2P4F7_9HYME|nr:hypothetical protein QAD02_013206 [Eretmocerus hayati]